MERGRVHGDISIRGGGVYPPDICILFDEY